MLFDLYLGVDYSGAQTPRAGLPGLRVYRATPSAAPREVRPPGARRHWTRRGLAEWLAAQLAAGPRVLVGLDHGFSFPLEYFHAHGLPLDWPAGIDDFCRHWPTADEAVSVGQVRRGLAGQGAARQGSARWRRLCERRAGAAKSVFHFDVPGQVATSTHAGLPWLRYLRQAAAGRVHVWPFDGWMPPAGAGVVAEVYPALWKRRYPSAGRTPDQHDAYAVARRLRDADRAGELGSWFAPRLTAEDMTVAQLEGWILGVS